MQLIENLFGSKTRIKVLKRLSRHEDWWFNITELAKDMNINKGALSKILNTLEKENLIILNRKGKIKIFRLNRENVFANKVIIPVFKMEEELWKYFKTNIIKSFSSEDVDSIILYGSYAKGSERLESDIDVMVVIKNISFERKCKIIAEKLSQEFLNKGILLTIDIIDEKVFKKLYLQREPSISSIMESGIILSGKSLEEMIR